MDIYLLEFILRNLQYVGKLKTSLLVIRQKGESQNGCLKKTKHAKFSEKRTFLTS